MKPSPYFTRTIKAYLDQRAAEDELFAFAFSKPHKNLDECMTYILNTVRKTGYNGFEDDEIFSLAVHYYDEDDIKVGKPIKCQVVVNHVPELTEEDKREAYENAKKRAQDEAYKQMTQRKEKSKANTKTAETQKINQQSLF